MKESAIVLLGSVAVMCAVIVFIVVHTTPRQVSQKVVLLGLDGLGAQNLKQASTPHLDSMHYQEAYTGTRVLRYAGGIARVVRLYTV
jgi:hypothetical protein